MMTDAERLFRKYRDAELIVRRLEQSGALAANEHETLKWALRWAHMALYAELRDDDEQEPTEGYSMWYRQKDPDLEKALQHFFTVPIS